MYNYSYIGQLYIFMDHNPKCIGEFCPLRSVMIIKQQGS